MYIFRKEGIPMYFAPLEEINGFKVRPGEYLHNGATMVEGGISFTIHSNGATACTLCLFREGEEVPYAEIPYPESYRIGNVFSMTVFDLNPEEFEYAYRLDGPYDLKKGLLFDGANYILDPYAKAVFCN